MSTVAATTKETKTSTKYTCDYTHLPPLAMVGAVTEAEAFSARPDWIHLVARAALKILFNSIMIGVKDKGDNVQFVQQVLKKIQAVAQQLNGDAGRDYGDNYFTDPVIQNHLIKFQQQLIKIEEEINERNKTRTPYEFLLPSKIPQSINI